MSKARQSARQRHNWTRIDMREGGRIGFMGEADAEEGEAERKEREKNILQRIFGGAGRQGRQNRRANRRALKEE